MIVHQLVAVIVLYGVCGFGAGWFFVRRLPWSAPERMTAAFGASFLFLYATSFASFVLDLPRAAYFATTLVCLALTVGGLRDARALVRDAETRSVLAGFACMIGCLLFVVALIRNYTGGGWLGDWLEHYQRARFFLERPPLTTLFLGRYWLPARPPLMNLASAHFMAHVGTDFAPYQVAMLLMNATVFLPLCLLTARWATKRSAPITMLVVFLLLNPMFAENATYAWTRELTNFWVLTAIYFYATALEAGEMSRWVAAMIAAAAGVLTHYSAAPYALFLGLHFLSVALPARRVKASTAAAGFGIACAIVASWIGWSLVAFGAEVTFGSNSTVAETNALSLAEHLSKFASNVWNTLVPHVLRSPSAQWLDRTTGLGHLKDSLFLIYQTNFPFALGSVGGALLAFELIVRRGPRSWSGFWLSLVVSSFVIAIVVNHDVDPFGIAHICLQPLVLMGVALLAVSFTEWPATIRGLALVGLAVDFVFGIALVVWFQHTPPPPTLEEATRAGVSSVSWINRGLKDGAGVTFLGDRMVGFGGG